MIIQNVSKETENNRFPSQRPPPHLLYDARPQAVESFELPLREGRVELDQVLLQQSQRHRHKNLEPQEPGVSKSNTPWIFSRR